jgi:predicted DNA-binding transcriptional regulator AlpA
VRNPAPIYKTPTFEPIRGSAVSTQLEPHQTVNKSSSIMDDVTFIRLPEVKTVTGLSKTSLYALIKEKSFPAPVRLGPRAVAWVKSEIRQWALERVQASRSAA